MPGLSTPLELNVSGPGWAGGKRHIFEHPFVLVGRDERSCLRLEDAAVSRRHAYLQPLGGRVFCVDLGSRTGIRWGGEVRPAGWLRPEQGVQIGPYTLELAMAARGREGTDDRVAEDWDPLQDRANDPQFIPHITLEVGNEVVSRLHMNRVLVLVGSSPACRIRLRDTRVSRYHCSLLRTPQGVWLIDLLHGTGTCLNGQSLRYALVKEGDRLQVGPYTLRVWYPDVRTETPPPALVEIPVGTPLAAVGDTPASAQRPSQEQDAPEPAGTGASFLASALQAEQNQVRELQQDIKALRQKLADSQAECDHLCEQTRAQEVQVTEMACLQARLEAAEAGTRELDVVRGERDRWQAEARDLQARLAADLAEREQLSHFAADVHAAQAERDRLQAEQETSRHSAEQAWARVSDLERALTETATIHAMALEDARGRWESERQALEAHFDLERQRHDEAVQATVREVQARAGAEREEWRQRLEAAQQQLVGEREAVRAAGARLDQESATLRGVRADLAARNAEHGAALQRLQELQDEFLRSQDDVRRLQAERNHVRERQRDIEILRQQLADSQAECDHLREQAHALEAQAAEVAGRPARLEAAEASARDLDVGDGERTPGAESEQAEQDPVIRGGRPLGAASGVNTLPELAAIPPVRRPELLLCPLGDQGKYVLKDVRAGAYYHLGEQEAFLLSRLDGQQTTAAICAAFEARFGEPLSADDLRGFLEMAEAKGFLQASPRAGVQARPRQSILFWRISLFDPDRLFSWLAPKIAFLWTRAFLAISLIGIVTALALVWANRQEMAGSLGRAWCWETVVLAWLLVAVLTTCHEFAHGLTCKRYGGEVHEVGFLLLFFMPCFYCNVSDAWLIREKSKRLWVTLAGGYCDLCLGALAAFAWRLTLPQSLPNYLAWVALSILGARVFFNFNPLLKLDGYYLLSDALELPNLRQRAWQRVMGHLRWLLWGAPRPAAEARGKFLLLYGVASWLFSLVFLVLMIVGFSQFLGARWGLVGAGAAALLGVVTFRGMFQGFAGGEVRKMILMRRKRTLVWGMILAAVPAVLFLVEIEDRASGPFQVRPASRAEVRAPVAGFLQAVSYEEGDRVYAGAVLAHLEVPDLASRRKQNRAQIRESQARLRLLEVGPRPEEVREQRRRVERAEKWRDLAEQDLQRSQKALQEDLERLDKQIAQYRAERDHARGVLTRAQKLLDQKSVSTEEYQTAQKQCRVFQSLEEQTRAQKRARQALGCVEGEAELARREKELADARGTLALLEAGTRPEEIEAERARLARLEEEDHYLEGLQEKVLVRSPAAGLITTPHLKEKVGQYLQEGDLIGEVEEPAQLQVEVALAEQDVARVQPDQVVELKARSLPFQTFRARVERVAPRAVEVQSPLTPLARGEAPGTVTVYCQPEGTDFHLRPGMTGYARIGCGRRCIGEILANRVLRYLRTEFWW